MKSIWRSRGPSRLGHANSVTHMGSPYLASSSRYLPHPVATDHHQQPTFLQRSCKICPGSKSCTNCNRAAPRKAVQIIVADHGYSQDIKVMLYAPLSAFSTICHTHGPWVVVTVLLHLLLPMPGSLPIMRQFHEELRCPSLSRQVGIASVAGVLFKELLKHVMAYTRSTPCQNHYARGAQQHCGAPFKVLR